MVFFFLSFCDLMLLLPLSLPLSCASLTLTGSLSPPSCDVALACPLTLYPRPGSAYTSPVLWRHPSAPRLLSDPRGQWLGRAGRSQRSLPQWQRWTQAERRILYLTPPPHCQLQGTSKDIDQSPGCRASPPTANTSGAWAGIGGVGCLDLSQDQRLGSGGLGSPRRHRDQRSLLDPKSREG